MPRANEGYTETLEREILRFGVRPLSQPAYPKTSITGNSTFPNVALEVCRCCCQGRGHIYTASFYARVTLRDCVALGVSLPDSIALMVTTQAPILAQNAIVTLTPEQAQADFDFLRRVLEEAHAGLYRYSTKAEMDGMFDAQKAKLNRPMSKTEFMIILSETTTAVRCGHTDVRPDGQIAEKMEKDRMLPLRVRLEGEHLVVVLNDTPTDELIRPGMGLLEINGHKVTDLIKAFGSIESGDGDIQTGRRLHIGNSFARSLWLFFGPTNDFKVTAQDAQGHLVSATLSGVSDAERKKNQNPVNTSLKQGITKLHWAGKTLGLRFLKEPEIAEVRLDYFLGDDYQQWIENTFKTLQERGTKTLIVDLRGNGGGKDMYGANFVSYLTDKPFRYFDHICVKTLTPSFKHTSDWDPAEEAKLRAGTTANPQGGFLVTPHLHAGLSVQSPGKYPFSGKVIVLIDGGTFSTAADVCAVLHHLKRATFVGEETGGGYYGNNSGPMPTVTLPISKLKLRLPMYEYWNAVPGYAGERRGTLPDYPAPNTVADLLRGVDAPLELAVRLATGARCRDSNYRRPRVNEAKTARSIVFHRTNRRAGPKPTLPSPDSGFGPSPAQSPQIEFDLANTSKTWSTLKGSLYPRWPGRRLHGIYGARDSIGWAA